MLVMSVVLGAAVLHATWNAMAHGAPDRVAGLALFQLAAGVIGLVALLVTGLPPADTWGYIIASALLHLAYLGGLLASYQLGQFSQMYPLARGTSPWVVAVVSIVVLHQALAVLELTGVLLVSAGLIALVFIGRPGRRQAPALLAAFGTGLMIAAYTVVDGLAVHKMPVATYMGWVFMLQGLAVPLAVVWWRGPRVFQLPRSAVLSGLAGGVVSMAAYGWCCGRRRAGRWPRSRHSARPASSSAQSSARSSSANASARAEPSPRQSSSPASSSSPRHSRPARGEVQRSKRT